jgi:hypothetical protein
MLMIFFLFFCSIIVLIENYQFNFFFVIFIGKQQQIFSIYILVFFNIFFVIFIGKHIKYFLIF